MIKVIAVGKIKNKQLGELIDDYQKKINLYHKIEVIEVKDETIVSNDSSSSILDKEALRVLKYIKDDDYVVLLDLHGQMIDSIEFAQKLEKMFITYSKVIFVIGGSLGLGDKLYTRANYRLKLSPMTFLHSMTRLILLEQIYRAFKINNNETYHKWCFVIVFIFIEKSDVLY